MPKVRKNKIPVFLRTHPLRVDYHLKLANYCPVLFKIGRTNLSRDKKEVVILLSLLGLEFFMRQARAHNIQRSRLVIFSNMGEIEFFKSLKPFLDIRRNRKLNNFFIPHFVELPELNPRLIDWTVKDSSDPIKDLDSSIKLSSTLLEFS